MDVNEAVGQVQNEVSEPQKVFSQEEVNKLIGREKAKAAEHATRAAEERFSSMSAAIQPNAGMQAQEQRNAHVSREIDSDAIVRQVSEKLKQELEQQQQKSYMEQVANNYLSKVSAAKTNYEDFEEVTKDFDPTAFPQLTFLVAGLENGGDIVYELSKNPHKLANIDTLAQRSPRMAQAELHRLGKSISDNRQAQAEAQGQQIPAPLDRLNSSRVSPSNGKMSIKELRKQPWLRG